MLFLLGYNCKLLPSGGGGGEGDKNLVGGEGRLLGGNFSRLEG